jgi:hypothetical protein
MNRFVSSSLVSVRRRLRPIAVFAGYRCEGARLTIGFLFRWAIRHCGFILPVETPVAEVERRKKCCGGGGEEVISTMANAFRAQGKAKVT